MHSLLNFIVKKTGIELGFERNYLTRFLPLEPVYVTSRLIRLKYFRGVCIPLSGYFPLRGPVLTTQMINWSFF